LSAPRGVLAAVLLLAQGCAAYRTVEHRGPGDLAWPRDEPRVRLDTVIDLHGRLQRGPLKVLGLLGNKRESFPFRRPYAVAWDGEDLLVADPGAGRIARIAPGGRIRLSPPGVLEQPIGLAACRTGIVVSDALAGKVGLLDRDLQFQSWLAEGFSRPTGVACSGERIYVVETGRHRIRVLAADGTWAVLGARGAEEGEFNFPTSIASSDGGLLVGDTLNFRVQRLDPVSGRALTTFGRLGDAPGEMPRIKGVAVDTGGHVWVSDAHLDRVSLYDADGVLLISIGRSGDGDGEFSFPAGIAANPDGRIAVVDSLNVRVQIFRVLEHEPPPGA